MLLAIIWRFLFIRFEANSFVISANLVFGEVNFTKAKFGDNPQTRYSLSEAL